MMNKRPATSSRPGTTPLSKRGSSRNKTKLIMTVIVLLAIVGGGWFAIKKTKLGNLVEKKNEGTNQSANSGGSNNLIEQYKEQLPDLKKKADDNQPQNLYNYAVAQYATGDVSGAEVTYRKQIEQDKGNAVAQNNLANALRDQKKYDEAITHYQEAIKLAPKTLSSYINLANVYQYSLKEEDKALEIYNQALKENDQAVEIYVLKGILYEEKKDKEKAKESYEAALKIQPQNKAAEVGLERVK